MTLEEEEEVDHMDLQTIPVKVTVIKGKFGKEYNGTLIIDGQASLFTITFSKPVACINDNDTDLLLNCPDADLLSRVDRLFSIKFISSRVREYIDVSMTNKVMAFVLSVIVDTILQLEQENEGVLEKKSALTREFKVDENFIPAELS